MPMALLAMRVVLVALLLLCSGAAAHASHSARMERGRDMLCDVCMAVVEDLVEGGVCAVRGAYEEKEAMFKELVGGLTGDDADANFFFEHTASHCELGNYNAHPLRGRNATVVVHDTLCVPRFFVSVEEFKRTVAKRTEKSKTFFYLPLACCASRQCIGRSWPLCHPRDQHMRDRCVDEDPMSVIAARVRAESGGGKPSARMFDVLMHAFRDYGEECGWVYGGKDCSSDLLHGRSNGVQCGSLARAMRKIALALGYSGDDVMLLRFHERFLSRTLDEIRADAGTVYAQWNTQGNVMHADEENRLRFSGRSLFIKHLCLLAHGDLWDVALGLRFRNVYDASRPGDVDLDALAERVAGMYVHQVCQKTDAVVQTRDFERKDVHVTSLCHGGGAADTLMTDEFRHAPEHLPPGVVRAVPLFRGYSWRGCAHLPSVKALRCDGWYSWVTVHAEDAAHALRDVAREEGDGRVTIVEMSV